MEGLHHPSVKSPHYAAFSSQPLPTSSLRDITALVFILMSLPHQIATPLLALYIFTDSSFVYVRMLALFVLSDKDDRRLENKEYNTVSRRLWGLVNWSKAVHATGRFIGIIALNSSVYYAITHTISYHRRNSYFNHLVILAKATILSDIIGSSSINTVTSISNKKYASKIQFENKHLNNSLLNSIACYLIVNYTTYCVNWILGMNHGAMDSMNQYSELYIVLCLHVVLSSIYRNTFHSNSSNKNNFHTPSYNVMKLDEGNNFSLSLHHITSSSAEITTLINGESNTNGNITTPATTATTASSTGSHMNPSSNLTNVNTNNNGNSFISSTTTTTSTPTSRTTTTILSTNNSTSHEATKTSSNVTQVNGNALVTLPASISTSVMKMADEIPEELVEIDLRKALQNERNLKRHDTGMTSIQLHNFEVFILKPFNSKLSISRNESANPKFPPLNDSPNVMAKNENGSGSEKLKLLTSESNLKGMASGGSNSTTIIDNMITIQPFWSVLASFKAVMKYKSLFDGQLTKRKTHGGEFLALPSSMVDVTILTIEAAKILLKLMHSRKEFDVDKVRIKINNIDWMYYKVCEVDGESYLLIYGLSSLFQYEIDIIYEALLLNHLIISTTTSDKDKVLNQLPADQNSSLVTLQISLVLTIELLSSKKSSYKKLKKDEHKKVSELTKTIDAFKSRIAKYNGKQPNESRIYGKLKGLKHQVSQLETEVQELKVQVEQLEQNKEANRDKLKSEETELLQELALLDREYEELYAKAVNEVAVQLKEAECEIASLIGKKQKNENKEHQTISEITKLESELKNMKKIQVLGKIQKRTKKVKEKIDTILPKVFESTAELQRQFEELVGYNESVSEPIEDLT